MGKKRSTKKTNFITQGSYSCYVYIICYILGFLRMIFFQRRIGDEGIANYAYAFELYNILYIISAVAISNVVRAMVNMRQMKGQYKNLLKIFKYGMFRAVLVSIVAGVCLFFLADFLATELFMQPNISLSLKLFAISLLPIAVMTVSGEYFKGLGMTMPVFVSRIISETGNLVVTLLFAGVFSAYGSKVAAFLCDNKKEYAFGAAAGATGVLIGGILGMLFMIFLLFAFKKAMHKQCLEDMNKSPESYTSIMQGMEFSASLQLLSLVMLQGSVFVNQILYFVLANKTAGAVSDYGAFYAKVKWVLYLPLIFAFAMESGLTVQIRRILKKDDVNHARQRIDESMTQLMVLLIPIAVYIGVLAQPLLNLLFKGQMKSAIQMLHIGSVFIVLYGIQSVFMAVLSGMDKRRELYVIQIVSFLTQVLSFGLVFVKIKTPVVGLVYSMILGCVVQILFAGGYTVKKLHYKPTFFKNFLFSIVFSILIGSIDFIVCRFMGDMLGELITLLICAVVDSVIYMLLILVTKTLREHELYEIPLGGLWVKLGKLLGII